MCDNNSAITVAKNSSDHKVMKHVDLRYKWIQERIEAGDFKVSYVATSLQIADIFTKALSRIPFEKLREMLGMKELLTAAAATCNLAREC